MFYDKFVELCEATDITRTKACTDCGLSRTAWRKWMEGGTPNGVAVSKFAEYFGVTTNYLLGAETKKEPSTDNGEKLSAAVLQNEKVLRAMNAFMQVPPELQDHLLATIEGLAKSRK